MTVIPLRQSGLVPPNDGDAEAAILSTCLLTGRVHESLLELRRSDFFGEPHRLIWSAISDLHRAGAVIDSLTVTRRLRDADQLAVVGGASYLAKVMDSTPAVANVAAHAEIVRKLARQRAVISECQRFASEGYATQPDEWAGGVVESLSRLVTPTRAIALGPVRTVDEMFAELPPVPWLVKSLDICPGAPTLLAGSGFSGKTVAAQSMAVSIAVGRAVWKDFFSRAGRVVHVDFEQGFRLTSERYQRLARAMGVCADELRGSLELVTLPAATLTSSSAESAVKRHAEGKALVIVDSLRACAPDVDENSSEFRGVLDMLTRVSESTGACSLVIHHSRKPSESDMGGAKTTIRGSSAIFDACSSVLVMSGAKGEPVTVVHEKARTSGITHEDFALVIEDVEIGGVKRAGLCVRTRGLAPLEVRQQERESKRIGLLLEPVLRVILDHPGISQNDIVTRVAGKDRDVKAAINKLLDDGRVRREAGPNRALRHHAVSS